MDKIIITINGQKRNYVHIGKAIEEYQEFLEKTATSDKRENNPNQVELRINGVLLDTIPE